MSYTVTKFVLGLKGLTPSEKAVANVLAYHAHADGSDAYPSMSTIADEAGFKHRQSAQRVVERLEKKGIIVADSDKKGGRGRATRYRIILGKCNPELQISSGESATGSSGKCNPESGKCNPESTKVQPYGCTKGPERTEREERGESEKRASLSLAPSERESKSKATATPSPSPGEVEVNELCARLYGLGRPAPPFTGKHREKVGRLLGTYSADELCEAYRQFVTDLDAFQLRNAPKHFAESAADVVTAMRFPKARVLSLSECTRLQREGLWPIPPGLPVDEALAKLKEKESERSKNAAPDYGDAMANLRAQRERLGMKLPDQPTKFISLSEDFVAMRRKYEKDLAPSSPTDKSESVKLGR